MATLLALQALFVPCLLSILFEFFSKKITWLQKNKSPMMILLWLFIYAWIVNFPNIPPKQATDWLGIASLLLVAPFFFIHLSSLGSKLYLFAIALLFILSSTWSVLTYEAVLDTHWLVWLEILFVIILLVFVIFFWSQYIAERKKSVFPAVYFNLSLMTGVFGVITILSGSLILGLLAISYSFILSWPAVIELISKFSHHNNDEKIILHYVITLFLLVLCRVYGEIPFISLVLIVLSLLTSLFVHRKDFYALYLSTILGTIALLVTVYQEFSSVPY